MERFTKIATQPTFQPHPSEKFSLKIILYFWPGPQKFFPKTSALKKFLYFLKKAPNSLETKTPKKSLYFRKRSFLILQEETFQGQKFFTSFWIKKQKVVN